MLERIIFNILAFSLFTIIFFKMIRKNDTNYIAILILEALGIAIGFIELLTKSFFRKFYKIYDLFYFNFYSNCNYYFRKESN